MFLNFPSMFSIKSQYVFYRFAVPAFYGLKPLNICKYALDKKMRLSRFFRLLIFF